MRRSGLATGLAFWAGIALAQPVGGGAPADAVDPLPSREPREMQSRCAVPEALRTSAPLPGVARALAVRDAPISVVVLDPLASGPRRPDVPVVRWPVRLQVELGARFPGREWRIETVGRAQQADVGRLAALLRTDVLPRRPVLVVWPVGRADLRQGVPASRFGERLRTGLETLARERIDTIVLDIAYHPQSEALSRSDEHRHHLRWVADDVGAARLRRYEMIEHWAGSGVVQLDSTDPAMQADAVDRVQRCTALALAEMIAEGARMARP